MGSFVKVFLNANMTWKLKVAGAFRGGSRISGKGAYM